MEKTLKGKKIAMVVAFQDFRDEELFIPRSIFLNEGAEVKIVSEKKGEAVGSYGGTILVDLELNELKGANFNAVVFVGGSGAAAYIENEECWRIARETVEQGRILGAICIAPAILARSGVLEGKKATVWSSRIDKSAVKILENSGALYENKPVVIDDRIITANGPTAARKFGEEIVRALMDN